jgi:heme/copper-type cytochrome/quinol oxidase subunit 1
VPRWSLWALLVAAVVCAGAGVALLQSHSSIAGFGWVGYSPLSDQQHFPVALTPVLTGWHWVGVALLATGAGTAGATGTALLLPRGSR